MMSTLIIIAVSSLAGFVAGLLCEWRIRKAFDKAKALLAVEKKKNTGVVRVGVGAQPSARYKDGKSSVIRPNPPKSDNADQEATLASVRNRAGISE